MEKEMNILFVSDEDGYKTMWIDGERCFDSSDGIMIEDVLHVIAHTFNRSYTNPANKINVRTYKMYEAGTGQIPDDVNDSDRLETWYQDTTGEEIEDGW
jgi:hypothetical protein